MPFELSESKLESSAQAFNRTMLEQLDHIEYRLVTGGEDLEEIYRLRYQSFLDAGMLSEDPSGMLHDRWDDLPNSYRFAIYNDGEIISTLRLHLISREFPYSPAYDTFPEALVERVERGETFLDVSRFAAYGDTGLSALAIPFLSMRLVTVGGLYFKPTCFLYAIKPEHSAFYRRVFSARPIAGPTPFPGLIVPRYLYETLAGENLERVLLRYPFLKGLPAEQRMLFDPAFAGGQPLTVLPTAKYAAFEAA